MAFKNNEYLFIYLPIHLPTCAQSQSQHIRSLVVAYKLLVSAGGIQFPDQGSNLGLLLSCGSMECQPLDHQGSPNNEFLYQTRKEFQFQFDLKFHIFFSLVPMGSFSLEVDPIGLSWSFLVNQKEAPRRFGKLDFFPYIYNAK